MAWLYNVIVAHKLENYMTTNVLAIGQNKPMNYLLQTVLENLYTLVVADEVFKGMHLLKTNPNIHLIIMDMDYQTKECIDFMLHISSSKLYNKPIIVLLSMQNQKANEAIVEANAYSYFIKPFNPIDLVNSVKELVLFSSFS